MKKTILLLLLTLLACENIHGNKGEDRMGDKEKTMNKAIDVFLLVGIIPSLIPAPFKGSHAPDEKVCGNTFSHRNDVSTVPLSPNRCPSTNAVGVCIFRGTVGVTEQLFYSPTYTVETATARCSQMASGSTRPEGVTFTTDYNVNSVYYVQSF